MHRHKKKNFLHIQIKRMMKSFYGRREEKGESMGSVCVKPQKIRIFKKG